MHRCKADEGHSACLTAGFCWPWSDPNPDGTLVPDVDSGASHDAIVKRSGDRFTDLVKRTYCVLLSRGLKSCYVYFQDVASKNRVMDAIARDLGNA